MNKRWYDLSATIELPHDNEITNKFSDELCDLFEKYGNWIAVRLSPIEEEDNDGEEQCS